MTRHVIIDGNNLLHTMRAHAPVPLVGRETMVKIVERWARGGDDTVTLFLDGRPPEDALARQMASSRIQVRFSGSRSADDLLVEVIQRVADPRSLHVVSADTAILYEAHLRGCQTTKPLDFIPQLFPKPIASAKSESPPRRPGEKPGAVSPEEARELENRIGDLARDLVDGMEF